MVTHSGFLLDPKYGGVFSQKWIEGCLIHLLGDENGSCCVLFFSLSVGGGNSKKIEKFHPENWGEDVPS